MRSGHGVVGAFIVLTAPFAITVVGLREIDAELNGKWHGPYRDRNLAFSVAAALKCADLQRCKVCRP